MQRVKQTLLACVVASTGFSLIAQNLSDSQIEESRRLLWESNETLQPTETKAPVTSSSTMSDEQLDKARNLLWQDLEEPVAESEPEIQEPVVDTIEIMEEPVAPAAAPEPVFAEEQIPVTMNDEQAERARELLWQTPEPAIVAEETSQPEPPIIVPDPVVVEEPAPVVAAEPRVSSPVTPAPVESTPSMEIVEVPVTLTPERLENARSILDRDMNRANNMETPPPLNLTTVTFPEGSSVEDNLSQLNQLYISGMISPELYHKKRAELVAQR